MFFLKQVFSHYTARILGLISGLILIPLISYSYNAEALGLLGIQTTLLALIGLVDFGIPIAISKEIAMGKNFAKKSQLFKAFEIPIWMISLFFLTLSLLCIPYFLDHWIKFNLISYAEMKQCITLILISTAIRFPTSFYTNIHFGLHHHHLPNIISSSASLLRIFVSLYVAFLYKMPLEVFFTAHLIINILETSIFLLSFISLRKTQSFGSYLDVYKKHYQSLMYLTGISLLAVGLAQADKIILSRFLNLSNFGIYTAATSIASGLIVLSYPVSNAIFPSLVQSFKNKNTKKMRMYLNLGFETTQLIIFPIAALMCMQASNIIQVLFLHKPSPYELGHILPWIAMGSLAQCLVTIPHSLQVAMGYEKRVFLINLFFLPLYILLVYYLVKEFQMIGAAIAFLAFNISRMLAHFLCLELSSRQRIEFLTKNISIFIFCALLAYLLNMIHISTMLTFAKLIFSFITILFFVFVSCSQLRLYLKKPITF